MQPYQEASQEIRRQGEFPIKAAATGASIAGSAIGSGLALTRITPFLSKYIPQDLAIKGLSKIDPRFGKFISTTLANGKSFDEIKDFISEKTNEGQAKENRSVIQQYSDELDAFIKDHISKGRQPLEAGAIAQLDPKFKKVISQIEKDHKTPFSAILESTYGSAQQPQQQNVQSQQQPAQSQQNTDQALMAALEKILQM